MLSRAMDAELVRAYTDELAFLTARLNRRDREMDKLDPEGLDVQHAVRAADFLVGEIERAVQNLQATAITGDHVTCVLPELPDLFKHLAKTDTRLDTFDRNCWSYVWGQYATSGLNAPQRKLRSR